MPGTAHVSLIGLVYAYVFVCIIFVCVDAYAYVLITVIFSGGLFYGPPVLVFGVSCFPLLIYGYKYFVMER